jgi:hypothetical protein
MQRLTGNCELRSIVLCSHGIKVILISLLCLELSFLCVVLFSSYQQLFELRYLKSANAIDPPTITGWTIAEENDKA